MSCKAKQWKRRNPPCKAQLILQKMFEDENEEEEDLDARIRHKNQPVLISVFRDPETEEEKVCVVAALPGGVSNVEFSLIGTGPGTNKNYLFLAANCLLH